MNEICSKTNIINRLSEFKEVEKTPNLLDQEIIL